MYQSDSAGDRSGVFKSLLRRLARSGSQPQTRVQALAALAELGRLAKGDVASALGDARGSLTASRSSAKWLLPPRATPPAPPGRRPLELRAGRFLFSLYFSYPNNTRDGRYCFAVLQYTRPLRRLRP